MNAGYPCCVIYSTQTRNQIIKICHRHSDESNYTRSPIKRLRQIPVDYLGRRCEAYLGKYSANIGAYGTWWPASVDRTRLLPSQLHIHLTCRINFSVLLTTSSGYYNWISVEHVFPLSRQFPQKGSSIHGEPMTWTLRWYSTMAPVHLSMYDNIPRSNPPE
jgi:hypothetical protein